MADPSSGKVRARVIGLTDVAKAIGSGPTAGSNQLELDSEHQAFVERGALEPPYSPEALCRLFENSNALRPNIDSYATNIDGFGYRLEPVFNLDSEDGRRRLATAARMRARKGAGGPAPGSDNFGENGAPELTADQIREALGTVADEMLAERQQLDRFFENCCLDRSFVKTRRMTRQDLEIMGNAYWEVIRNARGDIAQLAYLPGFTIRLLPAGPPVVADMKVRSDDLAFEVMKRRKRFRLFIQLVDQVVMFFKELGDKRIVSARTGMVFESAAAMREAEGEAAIEATEILHFKVESPASSYGVPRWIGALLAVMGSRQSEEVNFLYFENKSVPPLALLVSGGRLTDESVKRIEDHIETNIKGRQNFHRVLVLEAEPAVGAAPGDLSSRMRIQIQPLTSAQQSDALFQKYDERNADKVGGSFRLPRLLRGDIRDFNRSTAMAALNFAEMQVFQPEREDFDWIMNNMLLRDMGVRFWRFVSRSPVTRDPVAMSEIIRNLANANVLTPEEGRELAEDVFNREFRKLEAPWVKQPMQMTLAGIDASQSSGESGAGADGAGATPPAEAAAAVRRNRRRQSARKLIELRAELEKAEEDAWLEMLRSRNLT